MIEPKKYKVGDVEFQLRDELRGENWDLYVIGSKILYTIRERKIKIDEEQKEIEINAGDFTREEFLQFASCGFVDAENNPMNVELCSQLPMKDSLEGFTNFFFIILQLEISSLNSTNLKNKLQNVMSGLNTTRNN